MEKIVPIVIPAAVSLIVAILTVFVSLSTIRKKARAELLKEFSKGLRTERLAAYKTLWKKLKAVALYSPPKHLDFDALVELSGELSEWYFDHGMFLTENCRDYYFIVQDALVLIINRAGEASEKEPYVLRDQNTRITMNELKDGEKALELSSGHTPEELRKNVLCRIAQDPKTDYYVLRFLSSQLRTSLAQDLDTREGLWVDLAQDKNQKP